MAMDAEQGKLRQSSDVRAIVSALATSHSDSHVRDLFEKYLPEERRPKRLGTAIKPDVLLAMRGNAQAGRRLFFENTGVQCRNCHKIQGQGTEVGPDLSQIAKKYDRARILDNVLYPSREVDPKFVVYLAESSDGKLYTGLLVEKTDQSIVLKDSKNNLVQLDAAQVQQLTPQQQSLMPDLLLRDMTAEQVADLLAFLSELK
jgi:putative heme-binding domain-containing protein